MLARADGRNKQPMSAVSTNATNRHIALRSAFEGKTGHSKRM
jgi:hypothetical protein